MFDWQKEIAVYVHLPWCKNKCPYCDFNSFLRTPMMREDIYIDSLFRDLEKEISFCLGRSVSSIYIGGGTPSLFGGESITRLLDGIKERLVIIPDAEITLEVNPESVTLGKFIQYQEAGVNRISIGVQSFSDEVLVALSRPHNASDAKNSFFLAREAGFENINIDIMFGVPAGDYRSDISDLNDVISLRPEHISRYQLTIEEGTNFFVSPPKLPSEDEVYRSHLKGIRLLKETGYQQYEVSAYSLAGKASRHNLNYWRYGDYIGIGAGAHGKITIGTDIYRSEKPKSPLVYTAKFGEALNSGDRKLLCDSDALIEYVINATRLTEGFELFELFERTGISVDSTKVIDKIRKAEEAGFLTWEGGHLKPTRKGQFFLNDLQLIFLE